MLSQFEKPLDKTDVDLGDILNFIELLTTANNGSLSLFIDVPFISRLLTGWFVPIPGPILL